MLKIKKSKIHGYGVFATVDIKKGKLIEHAPVLLIDNRAFKNPVGQLDGYVFAINKKFSGLALLHGSMYNHSDNASVQAVYNEKKQAMDYYALRDIKAGEELFLNYGAEYWKNSKETKK